MVPAVASASSLGGENSAAGLMALSSGCAFLLPTWTMGGGNDIRNYDDTLAVNFATNASGDSYSFSQGDTISEQMNAIKTPSSYHNRVKEAV